MHADISNPGCTFKAVDVQMLRQISQTVLS